MSDKVTFSLCFEVEADPADVFFLKRVLQNHPGAPMWLRHYVEMALERLVRDAQDGGVWKFEIKGGKLNGAE